MLIAGRHQEFGGFSPQKPPRLTCCDLIATATLLIRYITAHDQTAPNTNRFLSHLNIKCNCKYPRRGVLSAGVSQRTTRLWRRCLWRRRRIVASILAQRKSHTNERRAHKNSEKEAPQHRSACCRVERSESASRACVLICR